MLLAVAMISCQTAYKQTYCDIVNTDRLQCDPTEDGKGRYDLPIIEAIGYRCMSPDGWADRKKKLREEFEVTE